jgi:4-hydroxy-tetrahydrodipicolinate reductase
MAADTKVALAVSGACGRMGMRVIQLAYSDPDFTLAAALEKEDHPHIGKDVSEAAGPPLRGIPLTAELPPNKHIDVVIDFSLPEGTMHLLDACVARRIPVVIATTGHSAEQRQRIRAATHETAILQAPNLSLSMNLLFKLVQDAAATLHGRDFDVEIVERHHRFKKDAPSGTALHLAGLIQKAMGQSRFRHGREGVVGERPPDEIGIHAVRTGDNVGEHCVIFSTMGETLELIHRAHSRDCYVRGALQAAKYLANRLAGWYAMEDVLLESLPSLKLP